MIWLQLAVLLIMIIIGSNLKGIGLGLMGVLGMFIYVQFFRMRPVGPPGDIMLIILSIVTASAALQAAGGLDYLVYLAEKLIRKNPRHITLIAPLTAFTLCLFSGTSHVVYSLLPVISDLSARKGIRPERPLSATVIASHMALTGSPMAACTAALATVLGYAGAPLDIMRVSIPACLVGTLAACLVVYKKGKELKDDPVYIEKMKDPAFQAYIHAEEESTEKEIPREAKLSVAIFGLAIVMIVIGGSFPHLVPNMMEGNANAMVNADGSLKMVTVISVVSLSAAALIMLFTAAKPDKIVKSSLFLSMATALVSVYGVVWMSATFMAANEPAIRAALGSVTASHPWVFTLAVFLMGILMFSQGATTKAMMPLGMTLGLPGASIIAMFPAVNSFFVLPGYPTILAAVSMDRTESTRLGKYVINHSFMLPGLVATAVAIAAGFMLAGAFGL
ncbi:MAG: anaerobic C4-dicarboxylate transporter [Chitinophagaceae bacterium]|jgi:anaerobic C4-dicarboxylate transporter DcuA|nr:anaerobic C4-dicarboxylate transporter [Chitinophagaceae bacterium]